MPTLKIANNQASNPIALDLSAYLKLTDDDAPDPYDPAFTQRVFSRSLLKEGASLPLVQLVEKEQTWNLLLGPFANQGAMVAFIAELNQALNTPGAVLSWQDDGLSQPTYFDLLVGEFQVEYSYRKAQRSYTAGKLLTFSEPLGHPAGPRAYAAASGVGPLLMVTPYASGGALAIGASTQAGVAGFGGAPAGPSSGIFYPGAPSLAGDAPALLQISYVGPLPNGASDSGAIPYTLVSLLPDPTYQPLITAAQITVRESYLIPGGSEHIVYQPTAVASSYRQLWGGDVGGAAAQWAFTPGSSPVSLRSAGPQRLFAIARASGVGNFSNVPALLQTPGAVSGNTPSVGVPLNLDWGLYDLGTFGLRASQPPPQVTVNGMMNTASQALDVAAFVTLPDAATWLLTPKQVVASQYGMPRSAASQTYPPILPFAPYTNTVLLDDLLGEQMMYWGASQQFAPSPIGLAASCVPVTTFSRGLVPRPDPKDGLPIVAILGVGQNMTQPPPYQAFDVGTITPAGASWANPQNLPVYAQVSVLERARYVLP